MVVSERGSLKDMRALILSCNTGGGHNSCAAAIKEVYDAHGDYCVIDDALRFISDGISNLISTWHVRIYRYAPKLFRFGYGFSERHPALFEGKSPINRLMTTHTDQIYSYLCDGQFDVVICTHPFAAIVLSAVLEEHPMPFATCLVATDYTCSPSTEESRLDRCFIPDSSLRDDFRSPNIPWSKMVASGIPIRQMFLRQLEKPTAKARFGIAPDHKHLLMACGSMGCGPMVKLAHLLSLRLPANCDLTIVCGTNQKLRKKLEHTFAGIPNVHPLGFVDDMSALLDSADLYLTKPGGLSVTEAAVKALPMVLVDAVAGCESHNRRFFLRLGGAATGHDPEQLTEVCLSLLADESRRAEMSAALASCSKPNASECIYQEMRALAPAVR